MSPIGRESRPTCVRLGVVPIALGYVSHCLAKFGLCQGISATAFTAVYFGPLVMSASTGDHGFSDPEYRFSLEIRMSEDVRGNRLESLAGLRVSHGRTVTGAPRPTPTKMPSSNKLWGL